MTVFKAPNMTIYRAANGGMVDIAQWQGRLRCVGDVVTYAAQTTSDTIEIALLLKGWQIHYGMHVTDTSSGSTTLAYGVSGTTGKYKAAAAFTATDTPTLFGVKTALFVAVAADEVVFITLAAATAPGSGKLAVFFYYTGEG